MNLTLLLEAFYRSELMLLQSDPYFHRYFYIGKKSRKAAVPLLDLNLLSKETEGKSLVPVFQT